MQKIILSVLPEKFGICHLSKNIPIAVWDESGSFFSTTRGRNELSVVCNQEKIPAGVMAEKGWKAFRLDTSTDLGIYSVGVISALAKPLAEAGISIFNISTYETNYIMVEEKNFEKAKEALSSICEIQE
jgi:hypothetical protein